MNIAVFDDDPLVREALRMGVEALGHNVDSMEYWPENTDQIDSYDIVFTDINMPDVDGFEVLRRVKEISSTTRVVAVTGDHASRSENALAYADFDALLAKPFSIDDLIDILDDA